tara:strand:- start:454 stop:1209 length:756 start_codon:yes stop_codon:yes gene_type:complete
MHYLEKIFNLDEKVIIVTGGSRGIGYILARDLAFAGATVIGLGRTKNINYDFSKNASYSVCDLSNYSAFESLIKTVYDKYGCIDGLVNVAGISIENINFKDNLKNFNETIQFNLTSIYSACNCVYSFMKESGGGSIINITSIGASMSFPNNPGYQSSKAGLRMLSKSLALDYSAENIRVNNISPGYIKTEMTKKSFEDKKLNANRVARMIIPRWGEPEDLSGAAIYLLSDASSYVTGIDLVVDGGWTAKGL